MCVHTEGATGGGPPTSQKREPKPRVTACKWQRWDLDPGLRDARCSRPQALGEPSQLVTHPNSTVSGDSSEGVGQYHVKGQERQTASR